MLISGIWEQQPTFRLIPIEKDCPYNEAIYDPAQKVLAVLSRDKKESYHFLPKLDDNGDILRTKGNKPRSDGKPYAEQRVMVPTYYEYFISNPDQIEFFVKQFAANSDKFQYKDFIKPKDESDKSKVSADDSN